MSERQEPTEVTREEAEEAVRVPLRWSGADSNREDLHEPRGYDHLDALRGDVFALSAPTASITALEPDMVFYQPTPIDHVFDLIDRVLSGFADSRDC